MTRRRLVTLGAALAAVVAVIVVLFLRLPKMATLDDLVPSMRASTPATVAAAPRSATPSTSTAQVPSSTLPAPSPNVVTRPSTSTTPPVTAPASRPLAPATHPAAASVTTAAPKMVVVPNVVGDDEVTAYQTLAEAGIGESEQCAPGDDYPSYVESQSPAAGSTIPTLNPATNTGNSVTVTFYCGPPPTTTTSAPPPPPTPPPDQ